MKGNVLIVDDDPAMCELLDFMLEKEGYAVSTAESGKEAIAMIELNSIAKGVETADAMLKTSDVDLVMAQPICAGKYMVLVSGDVDHRTDRCHRFLFHDQGRL